MKNSHLYLILACGLLLLGYALSASFFYRSNLEQDLYSKAEQLLSSTEGMENVTVSFSKLDARLSGEVANPELKKKAARLIAGLPSVKIASNTIGIAKTTPPQTGTEPDKSGLASANAPPPAPPPPKPNPSTLTLVSNDGDTVLTGVVTSLARKKQLVKPFALTGSFFDLQSDRLKIDPKIQPDDWPEALPRYLAIVATKTKRARLILTNTKFEVVAAAVDERAARQIEHAANTLNLPGRQRNIDITAQALPEKPADGFFFYSLMNAQGNRITLEGRLGSHEDKDSLIDIVKTDLPEVEVAELIEITPEDNGDWSPPEYSARLPNMLSLFYSRVEAGNIIASANGLYAVGEMKPGLVPEDLSDLLQIMLGTETRLLTDLTPNAADFASVARPAPPAPPPAATPPPAESSAASSNNAKATPATTTRKETESTPGN
ncbi:MAG: hypothetical protein AAF591_02425 [Verrucomicrobiota bacterium]